MNSSCYSLEVLVNGKNIREYNKDGKTFVSGKPGTEYVVRVRNNNYRRIMAIVSVDGLDCYQGKVASEQDIGYVIEPYQTLDLKGYRIDQNNVAAFKFVPKYGSYANIVGVTTKEGIQNKTTKNNGTIGCRIYQEKVPIYINSYTNVWPYNTGGVIYSSGLGLNEKPQVYFNTCSSSANVTSYQCSITNSSAQNSSNGILRSASLNTNKAESPPNFDIGTSWGSKIQDKITYTNFDKESSSFIDMVLYYATKDELISFGIDFEDTKKVPSWPEAFPKDTGFCKKPDYYN